MISTYNHVMLRRSLFFLFIVLFAFPLFGFSVYIINVKQGSSSFIKLSEKSGVLIDAGRSQSAPHIIQFLKSHGIDTIKLAIMSHPDLEHIGGFEEIIQSEKFIIKKIIKNQDKIPDRAYKTLIGAINRKKIPVIILKKNGKMEGLEIKNVNSSGSDFDHRSLGVYYSDYKSIAVMGDADVKAEKDLLPMKADVIVLGNHGESKSTCKEFLDSAKPEIVLISAEIRRLAAPTADVLNRLKNKKITYFRTDKAGDIDVSVVDWVLRVNGQEVLPK
jgi:competence protein ComEC